MKYIKKYNENVTQESNFELLMIKEGLELISEYDINLGEAIECINTVLTESTFELNEIKQSLSTNYTNEPKDEYLLELIYKYVTFEDDLGRIS